MLERTEAGSISTGIEVVEESTTVDDNLATATGSFVTAAERLVDNLRTIRVMVDRQVDMTNITQLVGTTVDLVDEACMDARDGSAKDVGTRVVVGLIGIIMIAGLGVSVTAAEDAVDTATIDNHIVIAGSGSITATIDGFDGILVAEIDMYIGGAHSIHGHVGSLVTTTVDSVKGVALEALEGLLGKVGTRKFVDTHCQRLELASVRIAVSGIVSHVVDIDIGVAEGGAHVVVGTKDVAADDGVAGSGRADVDGGDTVNIATLVVSDISHFAATVDGTVDESAENVDLGVAEDAASDVVGAPVGTMAGGVVIDVMDNLLVIFVGCRGVGDFIDTVSAAIDVAEPFAIVGEAGVLDKGTDATAIIHVDNHVGVTKDGALFGATGDGAHDGGSAGDVDTGGVGTSHGDPGGRAEVDITLTAAINIAGTGVGKVAGLVVDGPVAGVLASCSIGILGIDGHVVEVDFVGRADDGAAGDVDDGDAGAGDEDGGGVPVAEGGHLTAAEDRAVETGAATDVDGGVGDAAGIFLGVGYLCVALTRAEDVAVALPGGQ